MSSMISLGVFRSADRYILFTDCCASGTDSDWHWFWVDPLGLCDIAMLLMSIPESTLSLGRHEGILNLSLND